MQRIYPKLFKQHTVSVISKGFIQIARKQAQKYYCIQPERSKSIVSKMVELKEIAEVKAMAEANSNLSFQLTSALKETHAGNLICSPFSLTTVLAIARVGAAGKTAKEIIDTMQFPMEESSLIKGFTHLLPSIQASNENFTLAAANRLYIAHGFAVSKKFNDAIKDGFLAETPQVNFANTAETAKLINDWVEKTTQGKITDLISPDAININTKMVMVNGIYFKGLWKDQFDPKFTRKAPFFTSHKDKIEVDMMNIQKKFPYGDFDEIDAHAIELPYRGDRLSMIIIVPKDQKAGTNGLTKVEEWLRTKNFSPEKLLSNLYSGSQVVVKLPRFKLECEIKLVPTLKKIGIKTMFDDKEADFAGISENLNERLFVSDVIQKAFIEVNEEGSEAAAATGMSFGLTSMPTIVSFSADHPFIFQIIDKHSNFVLFTGRCANPLLTK